MIDESGLSLNDTILFLFFRCQTVRQSNRNRFAMEALHDFCPTQPNVKISFSVKMGLLPYNNVRSIIIGIL